MTKVKIPSLESLYTFRQSLTNKSHEEYTPISDQFILRTGNGWTTYFQLFNLLELFPGSNPSLFKSVGEIQIVIFDCTGKVIQKHTHTLSGPENLSVNISQLVASDKELLGTFAVFHSETPRAIRELGGNLSERGYVSYSYKSSPVKSFAHGNYDAITMNKQGRFQSLSGRSFMKRKYCVQHDFDHGGFYELFIVNTTDQSQIVKLEIFSEAALQSKHTRGRFRPRSAGTYPVTLERKVNTRGVLRFILLAAERRIIVMLESNSVMLRPIIFHVHTDWFNVFHS
jgi:hypothetical protein